MKRLIWFPTGRRLWLDLADRLEAAGIATPVLWLGDDRHLAAARQRFPGAEVLALGAMAKQARHVPAGTAGCHDPTIWQDSHWHLMRDHALKLMDRADHSGRLTLLERDAWLHELVLWATGRIETLRPDALVMAEAPHSAPMYVFYAVAQAMGVRVLCFASWPLVPGLMLRRGLDGPVLPVPRTPDPRGDFLARATPEIESYLARFEGEGYGFQPRYMQVQANQATGARDLKSNPRLRRIAGWLQLLVPRRNRAWRLRRQLQTALAKATGDLPAGAYVYFPLHYEPERTTTPDGGAFHDQIRTLLRLRTLLPPDVAIVVKEHPSTFNAFMHGHLGRHPRHYGALRRIAGLHLLPASHSSAELLRGCAAVATITGTVALEAAALGKPALVLGNAWFGGCPSTHGFTEGFDWPAMLAAPRASRAELRDWLLARLDQVVLPGTVNPSNERYFAAWYRDGDFARMETKALVAALQEALGNE